MKALVRKVRSLRKRDEGASAVEYGLLVALIAVAIAFTVALLGGALDAKFGEVEGCVADGTCPAAP